MRPVLGGGARSLAAREKLPPVADPLNAPNREPVLAMRLAEGGVSSGPLPLRTMCPAPAGDARSAALPE
jgi:hypothetical protein